MDAVFTSAEKNVRSGKSPSQSPERGVVWCRTASKKLERHDRHELRRHSPVKKQQQSQKQQQQQQPRPTSQMSQNQRHSSGSTPLAHSSNASGILSLKSGSMTPEPSRNPLYSFGTLSPSPSKSQPQTSQQRGSAAASSASSATQMSPMLHAKLFKNRHHLPSLHDDDESDDAEFEEEEEEDEQHQQEDHDENDDSGDATTGGSSSNNKKKSVMNVVLTKRDPNMRPGIARRTIGPELARLALDLRDMGKGNKIIDVQMDLRGWKIDEMLAGADDGQQQQQKQKLDDGASDDGNHAGSGGGGGGGGGANAAGSGKRKKVYDGDDDDDNEERRKLRNSFENAFSPLAVDALALLDGKDGKLRSYDQKLMYVRKRLLMEEAAKRRASVRYIRDITGTLRNDEKLLEGFTQAVRQQQLHRAREHRAAQETLDGQRKIFLERTSQQRAHDFARIQEMRTNKVERSRLGQEEAFLATCENAMAMRRGASFSRQYAWLPVLALVLRSMAWMAALKNATATLREERVMSAAQRDFQNVFVPVKVTGFLRLAQGYKDAATKKPNLMMGGGSKAFSKQDLLLHQEIKKKKMHYIELRRAELDHPQWTMDRLLVRLRELQFPVLFMMWVRKRRHISANRLVSFLRTMFQQTVIRVRCKCYLKYVRNTVAAWMQALKNRRTRRHFMWVLQFRDLVEERKTFDLPACVEADHVLKRRERMRQKCALEQKRAYEACELLRARLVEQAVQEVARHKEKKKNEGHNDDDYDAMMAMSVSSPPGSPMSGGGGPSPMSRPGTTSQFGGGGADGDGSTTRPSTAAGTPLRGLSAQGLSNRPLQQGYLSPINSPTSTAAAPSPSSVGGHASAFSSPTLLQQQQQQHQSPTDVDIYRTLAGPVMIPHPYGRKFGPQPREAAIVARHMMDHFRCAEIKWAPSDTCMNAVLDWALRAEDRAVLAHFQQWIAINKHHRERADFLKSVLSHMSEGSATKPDLEAQYEELLKTKPMPPRQPYILPSSEMRVFVYAAYTLTAHEKRVLQAQGGNNDDDSGGGGGGGGNRKKEQQHPVFNEPNIRSHISKAMGSFKELHGNIRPFLLHALGF